MTTRRELQDAVMAAGRASTTAGVLLHTAVAERVGLNSTDTRALDLLLREGPMTAGELATHTGLASASVTALIDRLEQRGFAHRDRDPHDRRRVVVRPDPDGPMQLMAHLEPFLTGLVERLQTYDDKELAAIARYMHEAAELARAEAIRLSALP